MVHGSMSIFDSIDYAGLLLSKKQCKEQDGHIEIHLDESFNRGTL